jgi:hypothetical protein
MFQKGINQLNSQCSYGQDWPGLHGTGYLYDYNSVLPVGLLGLVDDIVGMTEDEGKNHVRLS